MSVTLFQEFFGVLKLVFSEIADIRAFWLGLPILGF